MNIKNYTNGQIIVSSFRIIQVYLGYFLCQWFIFCVKVEKIVKKGHFQAIYYNKINYNCLDGSAEYQVAVFLFCSNTYSSPKTHQITIFFHWQIKFKFYEIFPNPRFQLVNFFPPKKCACSAENLKKRVKIVPNISPIFWIFYIFLETIVISVYLVWTGKRQTNLSIFIF